MHTPYKPKRQKVRSQKDGVLGNDAMRLRILIYILDRVPDSTITALIIASFILVAVRLLSAV